MYTAVYIKIFRLVNEDELTDELKKNFLKS